MVENKKSGAIIHNSLAVMYGLQYWTMWDASSKSPGRLEPVGLRRIG
jgi:hypothetical protein